MSSTQRWPTFDCWLLHIHQRGMSLSDNINRGVSGRVSKAVAEGEEDEEFWAALGGKGEYPEAGEGETVAQVRVTLFAQLPAVQVCIQPWQIAHIRCCLIQTLTQALAVQSVCSCSVQLPQ